jgi:signal transduction histidine kinase
MDQICTDPKAFEQIVNENMCRNGERVWIAWTNRVVQDAHGQGAEILSVGTDITARRQAEEEVRRLHEDLQRHAEELERRVAERTAELAVARDRAETADRLKSAFLATMSHELRTPLNSIIGFTGIVLKGLAGPLTAEQNKQLDIVRAAARHLLDLINDVLDISKIEAGELTVSCEPVDLQASIAKAVGIVKPLAERKGLALRVHVPLDLGQTLSDERRVQQVLLNLLTNAVKFTERGEVALTVEATSDAVHMRVADTGIGIKPEDLAIVFQPFRQVDSGTTRNHEGTGLGLAICRRLADLMGGEIRAESEWGKGSVFTFILPVRRPAHI